VAGFRAAQREAVPDGAGQRMQNATKERGYQSPSAFIRAAIETELKSRSDSQGMEEQTAASFDRLAKGASARPSWPAGDLWVVGLRTGTLRMARERHMRLIKTAGQSLANESVMHDLPGDESEWRGTGVSATSGKTARLQTLTQQECAEAVEGMAGPKASSSKTTTRPTPPGGEYRRSGAEVEVHRDGLGHCCGASSGR
jgi:hypothetical protein